MYSITITVPDTAKLVEVAKLLDNAGVVTVGASENMTTAPKSAKAASTKKADAEPETKVASTPKVKEPTQEEKEKAYEPVKAIALQLNKEKGRDVLLRVLGAFDEQKAPDLKMEQYADFVAAAEDELMV